MSSHSHHQFIELETNNDPTNLSETQYDGLSSSSLKDLPGNKLSLKVETNRTLDSGSIVQPKKALFNSIIDSFKRKPENTHEVEIDPESQEPSTTLPKNQGLNKRHVILISLGGGLGTGLLVGIGKSLTFGGAGGLFCGFGIVCIMLIFTMIAAGDLAVAYSSIPGGFNAYTAKLVDPSLGFAIAWNYTVNWLTVLPLEMVTASMTIKYWNDRINPNIFIAIFFPVIVIINLFGSRGYAEAEFILNLLKVIMISGFIILGLLIDTGKAGDSGYIGLTNLQQVPMFPNGFKGICSVFVTAAFSFGGTEFLALTAADQKNSRKAIPSAIKHVCYRMVIIYFLSIFIVCLLVPSTSPQLMGSGDKKGSPVSPYVIAISSNGISVIPHFINGVILASVLSVANAALYSSSRTLHSLAQQGFAPRWFDYIDQQNRPIRAMLVSILVGLFSFIAAYENQEAIFTWLLSLSGLAIIFTWCSISLSHIRFLRAFKVQGVSTESLGFHAGNILTSSIALGMNILILVAQFWVSLFPFNNDGKPSAVSFFQNYMAIVSFICFYVGHKIYLILKKPGEVVFPFIKASEIDIVTDRKIFDLEILQLQKQEEKTKLKTAPFHKKLFKFFC